MAANEFPVRLTERSAAALRQMLRANPAIAVTACVRVTFENGGARLNLVATADPATDLVGESCGFPVAVPRRECAALAGYVVDYRSVGADTGFVLNDPRGLHWGATDPGRLALSEEKLRRLQPELFAGELAPGLWEFCEGLADHLQRGDSRAAVVVSVAPLVVAAYTDELDCVALLGFPDDLAAEYQLQIGSRLLTVNMYQLAGTGARPGDLVPGPHDTEQFINYTPLIADFLTADANRVERRKKAISEDEWARAVVMGRELVSRGARPRDGRPLHCARPA